MKSTETTPKRVLTGTAREATRCPIFLLQQSVLCFEYDSGDCGVDHGEDGELYIRKTGECLSGKQAIDDYLVDHGFARREWSCNGGGVWFTRQEAKSEAERRDYHYGREGKDWRVYCVCAQGELEALLQAHSEYDS